MVYIYTKVCCKVERKSLLFVSVVDWARSNSINILNGRCSEGELAKSWTSTCLVRARSVCPGGSVKSS